MKEKLPERRRFIRAAVPLKVIVKCDGREDEVSVKNVSPVGVRFEIPQKLDEEKKLALSLYLPSVTDPISIDGKVAWQTKVSLEDLAPYDVGVEIVNIKDRDKNTFLKYLCDLLYGSVFKERT